MVNANQPQERRRLLKGIAFVAGLLGSLAFFGLFPGLPHVIDGGAILVSVGVGALAGWAYGRRLGRSDGSDGTGMTDGTDGPGRSDRSARSDETNRTG
ncbi:hypothetical protein [Streptomyces sp. NPDC048442]|uniref:hypothetical protein n=1 Tax=Streptomyces sp. NPDC048442 TaxID=3154823 RepID=UPI00341A090E